MSCDICYINFMQLYELLTLSGWFMKGIGTKCKHVQNKLVENVFMYFACILRAI